jgi:hypothetical protein
MKFGLRAFKAAINSSARSRTRSSRIDLVMRLYRSIVLSISTHRSHITEYLPSLSIEIFIELGPR